MCHTRKSALFVRVMPMVVLALFDGMAAAQHPGDGVRRSAPPQPSAQNVPTLPREQYDDPPAPAEVLGRRGQSPPAIAVRVGFVSVQVNLNAAGNNILGDAANEPSIAVDPTNPNVMAIGWRQFDTIASNFRQAGIAFSTDGGATWTFPGVLDPGQFRSDPVLGSDAAGNFYYSSLSSLSSIEVFKSVDGGQTWGPPVPAFGGDKQWITVDRTEGIGAGNVYQIWNSQFSCCAGTDFTRTTDGGASFDGPYSLPNPRMKWGTLDVGPDGALYAAGTTLNQTGHVFGRSLVAQNPGANPTFDLMFQVDLGGTVNFATGPNPAGLLGQTWVVADPSGGATAGNIYILQSVDPPGSDPLDVHFIRSEDGGFTWSPPVRVNDDPVGNDAWQWFGTMSVAPSGRIDVVWNDTRNSGVANLSELFYSTSFDGGQTWSVNIPVSPTFDSSLGWPQQNKLGDYYHMISDDAGANLAYAATFNGEQDVYFLRLPADCSPTQPGATDCNANGVADVCDIGDCDAGELSCQDCNGNGLPDECDLPPLNPGAVDCDANGVPDECDPDCDANDVVDACDCLASAAPLPEANVVLKNRYLTLRTAGLGCRSALRVTFVDLPRPFDLQNGRTMWVGVPMSVSETAASTTPAGGDATFRAATLGCAPVYRDWSDSPTLYLHHAFIVPGGTYALQALDEGCDPGVSGNYSAALKIETAIWGDVTSACDLTSCAPPDGAVNVDDALSTVRKFANAVNAPIKARADLEPGTVDSLINVSDVVAALSGFAGVPFPFPVGAFPCNSAR